MTKDDFVARLERDGWIGVDLDGTLAEWTEQTSPVCIGPPVLAMVKRVKAWIDEGRRVKIVTARVGVNVRSAAYNEHMAAESQRTIIRAWLDKHLGYLYSSTVEITSRKDLDMLALWDDMAVTVERNTGRPMSPGFEEDMGTAKVSILCIDGTMFYVDLREIYMLSISNDGTLLSIFWRVSVRGDGRVTRCPATRDEIQRFRLAWEEYEGK